MNQFAQKIIVYNLKCFLTKYGEYYTDKKKTRDIDKYENVQLKNGSGLTLPSDSGSVN